METPLVSVCMTTYNHAPYLRQAVESVLSQQTLFDFELVLGEDCSTDLTAEICREYAAKYPGCGMCYTGADEYWQAEGTLKPDPDRHYTDFEQMLLGISVPNCTALARRELIAAYYAEIRPEEHPEWLTDDWPMWLWFACRSRIRFIDRVTAVHRRMVGSVSHGDSYRGRLASRDSAMETSLWFDERFTASRNRFRILRRRHVVGLWLLSWKGAGVGEYLARWWADLRRTPRLVFCPEGAIFLVKKILFRRKKQHL